MEQNLEILLSQSPEEKLREFYGFWNGGGPFAGDRLELIAALRHRMTSPAILQSKSRELGRKLTELLDLFLERSDFRRSLGELQAARPHSILSRYEMDAALTALTRRGFLIRQSAQAGREEFFIPQEIGQSLRDLRRRERRGIRDLITLKGFLESHGPADPNHGHHEKETYGLFAQEAACLARLDHLPAEFRDLLVKVILGFGGLLPRSLFERLSLGPSAWETSAWREKLESSFLGTVAELPLERYGIHHAEETLIVFQEISAAYLRLHAHPRKKDPGVESVMGVDFVSNLDRFVTYVLENPVKFTVKGEIFRTTEKRIAEDFLRSNCRELQEREALAFIYKFALEHRLIDRTGERTFALSRQGRDWKGYSLEEKLQVLLKHSCEEKGGHGDSPHQHRLRRLLLKWLPRIEPGEWYEAMTLPFLVRNAYLASLDQGFGTDLSGGRISNGSYAPSEDLQQMSWNLFAWIRKRLHPLGIVDLAYDKAERPVALRLSRMGHRVLAPAPEGPAQAARGSHVVVNPDFEVVLFPTDESYEIVHALDRFCERTKSDRLFHYRLTEESTRRALAEGVTVSELISWLRRHSRVPVPQNIVYSILDWAHRTGVLTLGKRNHIAASRPEVLDRFLADPRVRGQISSRLSPQEAVLKRRLPVREVRRLVLDLGFFLDAP